VAGVAVERDVPFVCIAFRTRSHFARDVGLPDDAVEALAAFRGGPSDAWTSIAPASACF
jgi:hypothetical protein